MKITRTKKTFALVLVSTFLFFVSDAFAAPYLSCTTPSVSDGTTAKVTLNARATDKIDWNSFTVVVRSSMSIFTDIKPTAVTVNPSLMTGDSAVYTFSVNKGDSYSAFIYEYTTKQTTPLPAGCNFIATTKPAQVVNPVDKTPSPQVVTPTDKTVQKTTKLDLKINNPLGVDSIEKMIEKIMGMIVKLAVPVIICFFLYSGFLFITAQGDVKKLDTAKKMFMQVVIGSVIILGAWTIAAAIVSTVNLITG